MLTNKKTCHNNYLFAGSEAQVPALEGDLMEDMMEDEEEFEEVEGELDWSESHGESLTPSQHSQPGRGTMEEVGAGVCLSHDMHHKNFLFIYLLK